jgi:hypothetical protein
MIVFLNVLVLSAVLVTVERTVFRPTQHRLSYAAQGFQGAILILAGQTGHKFRLSSAGERTRSASPASASEAWLSSGSRSRLSRRRRCPLGPAAVALSAACLCSLSVTVDVTLTVSVFDTVRERVRVRLLTLAPCRRAQQQDVEPVPGVLIDHIRLDQIRSGVRSTSDAQGPCVCPPEGCDHNNGPGSCPCPRLPLGRHLCHQSTQESKKKSEERLISPGHREEKLHATKCLAAVPSALSEWVRDPTSSHSGRKPRLYISLFTSLS